MYKYIIIFLFSVILNAQNIKIASYNVENFFDLNYDKTEYNEYIPNSKSLWNQRNFDIKLKNILKVIEDLDADIIALQEVENEHLIKLLKQKLPKYSYYSFSKYQNSAVGLGFLSKIPIKNDQNLNVKFQKAVYRPILETTFKIDDIEFKVFNNHWPSKKASESYRIKYAKTLYDRVKELPSDYPYILLGDFNSDYNELQTFKNNKRLNTTAGITGINHILNTTIDDEFVILDDVNSFNKKVHYNLWLELPLNDRFSTKFRNQNNTPDNMIISSSLLNNSELSYIKKSFAIFKPNYLFEKNSINRWEMGQNRDEKIHKGEGFSDHLPIFALFSTNNTSNNSIKSNKNIEQKSDISSLYQKEKLLFPIFLNEVIVLYKSGDQAIIKQENNRAIYLFKGAKSLKEGFSYNIQVNQIYDFYGLKELKGFNILKENSSFKNYKDLFLDGSKIDIFDFKYENEIITNLKGFITKGKLQINGGKTIRLFAKDKNILPKDGTTIEIINAQLGSFKGNTQIIFHTKDDYKELK